MGRRERMVEIALEIADDDSHGYSQYRRWPLEGTDYDCSSLMYWCANQAGYDVPTSGYTGTMLDDFTNAGFTAYTWDGNIWDCEPGDILLAHNDYRQHTEMYVGDGYNVGAHIAETGNIDGEPGDQTGNEISVAPNWGDWDYVLTPPSDGDEPEPQPEPSTDAVVYRVSSDPSGRYWYDEMHDHHDTGGSGDTYAGEYGEVVRWIAVKGCRYRVHTTESGWLPWVDEYDIHDLEYGCAGDGSPITGVEIDDSSIRYAAHILGGGWYPDMIGRKDTGGSNDTFAGDLANPIDAIRMCRA